MYQFSRTIYRELSPLVIDSPMGEHRQQVLDACENTMQRLLTDRRYFAKPTKALFSEIRACFPINEQLHVLQVIDRNVRKAILYLEVTPPEELMLEGNRDCRAHTRKGTPCQREPLPGRDYCPSHKHLEEEGLGLLAREAIHRRPANGSPPGRLSPGPRPSGRGTDSSAVMGGDAARSRRRRDLHRRRAAPRRHDPHREGRLDARRSVARASWRRSMPRSSAAAAEPGWVEAFNHGMTVGTNALLERARGGHRPARHRGLHRPARDRPPGPGQPLPALRRPPGPARRREPADRRP